LVIFLFGHAPRKEKVTRAPKAHESSCFRSPHRFAAEIEPDPDIKKPEPKQRIALLLLLLPLLIYPF
jgi:hypothetical protein